MYSLALAGTEKSLPTFNGQFAASRLVAVVDCAKAAKMADVVVFLLLFCIICAGGCKTVPTNGGTQVGESHLFSFKFFDLQHFL